VEGDRPALPVNMRAAVLAELSRAFHSPYEAPIVVVVNGALMCGAWFLLPSSWTDWLFVVHGINAFPILLSSWMFADVPATNVIAPDRARTGPALHEPLLLRRLLYAKNAVLWLLIAPFCSAVALGVGIADNDFITALLSIALIAVLPLGALGMAAWLGIRLPYHPRELDWRWEHRRQFRRVIVRWLSLAVAPYGIVPVLTAVMMLPTLIGWSVISGLHIREDVTHRQLAAGTVVACAVAAASWWAGHRVGVRMACGRRRAPLEAYLADPELG
jgi:hypothetical protein